MCSSGGCYSLFAIMTFPRARPFKVILRQLQPDEVSDTWGGSDLIVPDESKIRQTYRQWVIEDVGPHCDDLLLAEGLRVIIKARAGAHFDWNDETFLTVSDTDIIALFG